MNNPLLNKLNKDLKFVYSDNDTLSIIFNNNEILMGVVGEFNNLSGPDTFLPHQTCKVSNANNVLKLLQECKNQRKGWLKL